MIEAGVMQGPVAKAKTLVYHHSLPLLALSYSDAALQRKKLEMSGSSSAGNSQRHEQRTFKNQRQAWSIYRKVTARL